MMKELMIDPLVMSLLVMALAGFAGWIWQYRQLVSAKKTLRSLLLAEENIQSLTLKEVLNALVKRVRDKIQQAKNIRQDAETEKKVISYHHKKLQAVLQVFPDAIAILDEAGIATYANEKLSNLIGVSRDQVIGRRPPDWCQNEKVLGLLVRYEGNVTRLRRSETIEFSPEDKPDKTIQVSALPIALPSKPELTVGILIIFRDISAESMARRSRDDFVAHVSHELKSPLNVIKLHSELLLDVGEDAQQRVTSINVINDEVERVSSMITDLLNITRLEVGSISISRKRIRFRDFLVDIFEKMQRAGEENKIRFNLNLPQSLSHLSIDKDLFRIAINNILSNAIKYNRPGGLVSMDAEETGDSIILRISDTGIGISAEDQNKIFEKFYRSEDEEVGRRNGHGLGLSLAQEIVVLHNGKLSVESEHGKGTTFILELGKTADMLKEAV